MEKRRVESLWGGRGRIPLNGKKIATEVYPGKISKITTYGEIKN
jgi:hypothetical protein